MRKTKIPFSLDPLLLGHEEIIRNTRIMCRLTLLLLTTTHSHLNVCGSRSRRQVVSGSSTSSRRGIQYTVYSIHRQHETLLSFIVSFLTQQQTRSFE